MQPKQDGITQINLSCEFTKTADDELVIAYPASDYLANGHEISLTAEGTEYKIMFTPDGYLRFLGFTPYTMATDPPLNTTTETFEIEQTINVTYDKGNITYIFDSTPPVSQHAFNLLDNTRYETVTLLLNQHQQLTQIHLTVRETVDENTIAVNPKDGYLEFVQIKNRAPEVLYAAPITNYNTDIATVNFSFKNHDAPTIPHTAIFLPDTYYFVTNDAPVFKHTAEQKFFLSFYSPAATPLCWEVTFHYVTDEQITTMVHEC